MKAAFYRKEFCEKVLIHLHMPKTAGSTLDYILEREYKSKVFFSFSGMAEEFKNLPYEQRKKIDILRGHLSFGVHKYLTRPAVYIVILRNPIERIISTYYFARRWPQHYLYEILNSQNLSLEDFLQSKITTELDNDQVRHISGVRGHTYPPDRRVDFGEVSRDILNLAISNLENYFAVVGLTERFDESIILMKNTLGWKHIPFYLRKNVTKERPQIKDIPRNTLKIIEKYNELDCELYEYVSKSFEEIFSKKGEFMNSELRKYVILNSTYQKIQPKYSYLKLKLKIIKRMIKYISPVRYLTAIFAYKARKNFIMGTRLESKGDVGESAVYYYKVLESSAPFSKSYKREALVRLGKLENKGNSSPVPQ